MENEEFIVGEDVVMRSTEVNGADHDYRSTDSWVLPQKDGDKSLASPEERIHSLIYEDPALSTTSSPTSQPNTIQLPPPSPQKTLPGRKDVKPQRTPKVEVRIPPPPRFAPLPYSSSKTGLVYDARMRFHTEPMSAMQRDLEIHPEDPRRILEIFKEIQDAGLVQGPDEPEEEDRKSVV